MNGLPNDMLELLAPGAPTREQLEAHVHELAKRENVLVWVAWPRGYQEVTRGGAIQGLPFFNFEEKAWQVFLFQYPGQSVETYGVALHEIAHCALGYDRDADTPPDVVLAHEEAVWELARSWAITPLDEESIERSLASYRAWQARRGVPETAPGASSIS